MRNPVKIYNSTIKKLFDLYFRDEYTNIVLKNSDVKEYMIKPKIYYFHDMGDNKILKDKLRNIVYHKDTKFLGAYEDYILPIDFLENQGILLDFKHEEDAFYFKLKYC